MMTAKDLVLAVIVMVLWGVNFPVGKLGISEFPSIMFMGLRFGVVALALVWFVRIPRDRIKQVAILSVTLGLLHFSLMFSGLSTVDAAVAAILIQIQVPFTAALSAVLYKDPPGWRRTLGMVVAIGGVAILAGSPREGSDPVGVALIIAASFAWTVANLQMKSLTDLSPHAVNGWMAAMAAPQLLIASLILEDGQWAALTQATWMGWSAVAFQAFVIVILTYGIWYGLLKRYSVALVIPYTLLVPIFGVISGILFLGEPATLSLAAGGVLTLVGVAIIVLRRPKLVDGSTQTT